MMKKTSRILTALALFLTVALLATSLVACKKTLSGTYSAEIGFGTLLGGKASYTFSGDKVTLTLTGTALGASKTVESEGTYAITEATDGTQTITITFTSEEEDASSYSGTKTFAQSEDGTSVTIGGVEYKKQ